MYGKNNGDGLGLLAVPYVFWVVKKQNYPPDIKKGLLWLIGFVALQITLGVLTVLSYVNIVIALIHQANAIVLFGLAVYFIHPSGRWTQKETNP